MVLTNGSGSARALPPGSTIDVNAAGDARGGLAFASSRNHHGPSSSSFYAGEFFYDRAFLGLTFDLPDGRHAGWAEVGVDAFSFPPGGVFDATLFGYAYETQPGRAIVAGAVPEPPSLALLAAGAAGLGMLRRKRRLMKIASAPSGR